EAKRVEYLKKTLGSLTDANGKPLLDDRALNEFREIVDLSMEIEFDKKAGADYSKKIEKYFEKYAGEAAANVDQQLNGEQIPATERQERILAEQERIFENNQKKVLAEAVLAGLKQSVMRDLTPEGAVRNRVRFDPATEKFVMNDA